MLKVIYAGNQYYGHNSKQGYTFEHLNLYDSLSRLPDISVTYFPYDREQEVGTQRMNFELLNLVISQKPDLLFLVMPHAKLDIGTLKKIKSLTTILGWFGDDHWIFHTTSKKYAPYMTWIATTYAPAIPLYKALGCKNVIKTQLAANPSIFKPFGPLNNNRYKHDVSFIGSYYPARGRLLRELSSFGIAVYTKGGGWPEGRIEEKDIPKVFYTSKINLDLNPPSEDFSLKTLSRFFFSKNNGRIVLDVRPVARFKEWLGKRKSVPKARLFEAMACGGFVIASSSQDLPDSYILGKEIITYQNPRDLIDKIKYYLTHEDERNRIAQAGYERTLRDHTYEKRFTEIFKKMGFNL